MSAIGDRTKEQAIFVGKLVLDGNNKESISKTLHLNSTSIDRMINVVLPQVDSKMHKDVMNYMETQHMKNKVIKAENNCKPVEKVELNSTSMDTKFDSDLLNKVKEISSNSDRKPGRFAGCFSNEEMIQISVDIANEILSGMTLKKIAEELNVNVNTINTWMDKYLRPNNFYLYKKIKEVHKGTRQKKENTDEIAVNIADYIIKNECTMKEAGMHCGVGNSVGYYVNNILPKVDGTKYKQVRNIVDSKKKASTPSPTKDGLQKIIYEFDPNSDNKMHNSVAICDYILKNNASLWDTAEHFDVSLDVVEFNIKYIKRFDGVKYAKCVSIGYKGKYEGSEYIRSVGNGRTRSEVTEQNSHSICNYIIANEASVDFAVKYFDVSDQTVKTNIDRMKKYDIEKWRKTMAVLGKAQLQESVSDTENSDNLELSKDNENEQANAVRETFINENSAGQAVSEPEPQDSTADAMKECVSEFTKDIYDAAIEQAIADGVVCRVEDIQQNNEPELKMNFWQRVKFVFGFGN